MEIPDELIKKAGKIAEEEFVLKRRTECNGLLSFTNESCKCPKCCQKDEDN